MAASSTAKGAGEFFRTRLPQAGYTVREPQLQLAEKIESTIRKGGVLLAEAGVGTGKTFAYMVPALQANRGVVVATNTIALQEQLFRKDLPVLRGLGWANLQAFIAKGKGQYLCLQRFHDWSYSSKANLTELHQLEPWIMSGGYDKATLSGVAESLWQEVSLDYKVNCSQCPLLGSCKTARERLNWKEPGAVGVTNHSQLLQVLTQWSRGDLGVFLKPGVLVIDEAHQFVPAVREFLTRRIGLGVGLALMDSLGEVITSQYGELKADALLLEQLLTLILQDVGRVKPRYPNGSEDDPERYLIDTMPTDLLETIAYAGDLATRILEDLHRVGGFSQATYQLKQLVEACEALIDPGSLKWVEPDGDVQSLATLLDDPGNWLHQTLFRLGIPVIMVSATLSVRGDFTYFREQLGDHQSKFDTLQVPSPFDYNRQVKVRVGRGDNFDHQHPQKYYQQVFKQIADTLWERDGNTLVLFTSRSALRAAQQFFAGHPVAQVIPLVFQGATGVENAIQVFRSTPKACLFGTAFWEGLDVVGDKLSTVIVTKLPFPSPDPLLDSELEQARARGRDPYRTVILPRMLLRLKQGVGRLIRSETDQGLVVVLDPRFTRQRLRWQDVLPFETEPRNS